MFEFVRSHCTEPLFSGFKLPRLRNFVAPFLPNELWHLYEQLLVQALYNGLLGFSHRLGKLKYLILFVQMTLFWLYVDQVHWYIPVCVGTDCLLPQNQMATLSIDEQFYIAIGGIVVAFTQILIGCWIGMTNPLRKLLNKIRHKSQPPDDSLSMPKRYSWWIRLGQYTTGLGVAIVIVAIGLFFFPVNNATWELSEKAPRVLTVFIESSS